MARGAWHAEGLQPQSRRAPLAVRAHKDLRPNLIFPPKILVEPTLGLPLFFQVESVRAR